MQMLLAVHTYNAYVRWCRKYHVVPVDFGSLSK